MNADALLRAGLSALKRNDLPNALVALKDAERIRPEDASILVPLGLALARATHEDDALIRLSRAVTVAPTRLDAWCAIGELKLRRFDYLGAADAFSRCLELDPQASHAIGVRARMLIKRAQRTL